MYFRPEYIGVLLISVLVMESFWERMFDRLYVKPGFIRSVNGECMLYQGSSRDKEGYARFRYNIPGGRQRESSAHRMAKMVEMKELDLGCKDASHLCHNKLCIYSPHIKLESSKLNNSRKKCVIAGVCTRHQKEDGQGYYPDCLLNLRQGVIPVSVFSFFVLYFP